MSFAEEVIRQMEWARIQGQGEGFNYGAFGGPGVTSAAIGSPLVSTRPLIPAPKK
jgi:hypothetical protein